MGLSFNYSFNFPDDYSVISLIILLQLIVKIADGQSKRIILPPLQLKKI